MTVPFEEESLEERRRRQAAARRKAMKSQRRWRNLGDAATIGGVLLVIGLWLAAVMLPLALMAAAIYYLLTH